MRHFLMCLLGILFLFNTSFAQKPVQPSSSEIYHSLQKLNFLGTALYVAAHPDDENTRLISYLSNGIHARTGYLSLTRGDGGQNLIGPEPVSYTHLRAHETDSYLVCRLLLEKKK